MASRRSDPVINSVVRFIEGDVKKIKLDSTLFALPSARVEHAKSKTRNMIAEGNRKLLRYPMCYFNLTGVGIC